MPAPRELSNLLFHADPMGTCCRENDAFDEYDRIARDLAEHLDDGDTPEVARARARRSTAGAGHTRI